MILYVVYKNANKSVLPEFEVHEIPNGDELDKDQNMIKEISIEGRGPISAADQDLTTTNGKVDGNESIIVWAGALHWNWALGLYIESKKTPKWL